MNFNILQLHCTFNWNKSEKQDLYLFTIGAPADEEVESIGA